MYEQVWKGGSNTNSDLCLKCKKGGMQCLVELHVNSCEYCDGPDDCCT